MMKRILVPLDHTPSGETVLPLVADLARSAGSTVRLLHVDPVPSNVVSTSGQIIAYADQEMARLEAERLTYLDATSTLLPGVPVERVVRFGDPVQEMLIEAEAFGADIIAVATSIRSPLRWTLSRKSAARIFRKSKIPVLLLRR